MIRSNLRRRKQKKPHIYKSEIHPTRWICSSGDGIGHGAKPLTAYRSWERNTKWVRAGRPGLKTPNLTARI